MSGLPIMQRWLYMVLRWHMDWRSCLVGAGYRISLQKLAEELYVEPVRGRHAAEYGSPSKKAVLSALGALEKARLIQPRGSAGSLIFFLPLARSVSVRSKDEGRMKGTHEGHDEGHGRIKSGQGKAPHEGRDQGHDQSSYEGNTSGSGVNHPSKQTTTTKRRAVDKLPVDKSVVLLFPLKADQVKAWIRHHDKLRGCRPSVVLRAELVDEWLGLELTGDELQEAFGLAKDARETTQNRSAINLPFLDIFVRRVIERRVVSRGKVAEFPVPAWWVSEAGIVAKAKALGVEQVEGEPVKVLRDRVDLALMLIEEEERQKRKAVVGKRRGGA